MITLSVNFILVIQESLLKNFENVSVQVTQCPDLKASPYNLMDSGEFIIFIEILFNTNSITY